MRSDLFLVLGSTFIQSANAWSCKSVRLEKEHYDLSALDNEFTIKSTTKTPPTIRHVSYAINPCSPLQKNLDLNPEDQCAAGTQLCRTTAVEKDGKAAIIAVTAYASDISTQKEPDVSYLNTTHIGESNGLRLVYAGTKDSDNGQSETVVDFVCDMDAGIGSPELASDKEQIITLIWKTKFACSEASTPDQGHKHPDKDDPDHRQPRSSSWGFFTWLFLIVFMLIAACLIFTLFLNYNRYGQLGLDLVPTMDSVKVKLPVLTRKLIR